MAVDENKLDALLGKMVTELSLCVAGRPDCKEGRIEVAQRFFGHELHEF